MLYKPQKVTVTPGTPGQAGRAASYECSAYDTGGAQDSGGAVPPPQPPPNDDGGGSSGGGSGIRFSGVGTTYVPTSGEHVYVDSDGDGLWNEQQITDAASYTCVLGTSEPIYVNGATTFITAPFCVYTG